MKLIQITKTNDDLSTEQTTALFDGEKYFTLTKTDEKPSEDIQHLAAENIHTVYLNSDIDDLNDCFIDYISTEPNSDISARLPRLLFINTDRTLYWVGEALTVETDQRLSLASGYFEQRRRDSLNAKRETHPSLMEPASETTTPRMGTMGNS